MDNKQAKKLNNTMRGIYLALKEEYQDPEPNVWEPTIGDPSGAEPPSESLGLYRYEYEAVVALTRELDKRWPGQWYINCGFQFSVKNWWLRGTPYVLALIQSWYTEDKSVEYVKIDDGGVVVDGRH